MTNLSSSLVTVLCTIFSSCRWQEKAELALPPVGVMLMFTLQLYFHCRFQFGYSIGSASPMMEYRLIERETEQELKSLLRQKLPAADKHPAGLNAITLL
ncbi:MAG: hypothetical protein V8T36_12610 [Ruthenibacterium lactatiformans]